MHIIATWTYSFEKVNDPSQKKKVAALKIGTTVQTKILTSLFGANVRDLATPRHSYHYLTFSQRIHLTQGFIVLRITDTELATIQNITLTSPDEYNRTYLWRNHEWYEFPSRQHIEYKKVEYFTGSSTPHFSGEIAAFVTTQEAPATPEQPTSRARSGKYQIGTTYQGTHITATKKGDWWWFSGTLTPADEARLWKAGAKFSQKRSQFYLITNDLSDDILNNLIGITRPSNTNPSPATPVFYLDNLTNDQLLIAQRTGAKQDSTGRWYYDQETMLASFNSFGHDTDTNSNEDSVQPTPTPATLIATLLTHEIKAIATEDPINHTVTYQLTNVSPTHHTLLQKNGAKCHPETGIWFFDSPDMIKAFQQAEKAQSASDSRPQTKTESVPVPNVMESLIETYSNNNPLLAIHRLEVLPDALVDLLPERPIAQGNEHLALVEIFVPSTPPSYFYITHRSSIDKNNVIGYNLLDNPLIGKPGRQICSISKLRAIRSATDQKLQRFTSFKPQTLTQALVELITTQPDIYGAIDLHKYPIDLGKIPLPTTAVPKGPNSATQLANSGDLTAIEKQNWQKALQNATAKNLILDPSLLVMLPIGDARYDSKHQPIAFIELFLFSSKSDYLFITEYDPTTQQVMGYNPREGTFGASGWNWHDITILQTTHNSINGVQQPENFTPAAIATALATLPNIVIQALNLDKIEPYKTNQTNTAPSLAIPKQPSNDDGLTLFPKWLLDARPKGDQIKTRDGKRLVFAKLFHPYANWYLFISEYDERTRDVFCYAIMNYDFDCAEWGWQSVDDLEQMKTVPGCYGLPMERDTSFKTMTLDEALAQFKHERGFGLSPDEPAFTSPPLPSSTLPTLAVPQTSSINTPVPATPSLPPTPSFPSSTLSLPKEVSTLKLPKVEILPPSPDLEIPKNKVFIPQQYVGDIHEIGTSYCFGFAIDRHSPSFQNRPIYLSIVGPSSSVDAVWAKLNLSKEIVVCCSDNLSVSLIPEAKTKYKRIMRKLEELSLVHVILIHEDLAEPAFGDKEHPTAYILAPTPDIKRAKIIEYVNKSVTVPIFDSYTDYLIEQGYQHGLLRDCQSTVVPLVAVTTDTGRWIEVISEGLRNGKLKFPSPPAS